MLFLVQEKYGKDAKIEEDSSSGSEEDEDAMVRIVGSYVNFSGKVREVRSIFFVRLKCV